MTPRLKPRKKYTEDVNVWVDEAIWGHRFYNDQTPWLVLLEFLSVFKFQNSQGQALNENLSGDCHEEFEYHIPRLALLRELVFNNPHIQHIEKNGDVDADKWQSWEGRFRFSRGRDPSYLEKRFRSFSDLARIVEFFQTTAVEPHRQRRWSSRFMFPYSAECLCADLPNNVYKTPDRRFFARGGELLYLMLSRSGFGKEVAEKINSNILRDDSTWNPAIRALLPETYESETVSSTIGYLPYAERPEYSALADTWLRLLDLELPGEALLDPLMRLSSLHMLLYMMRRSKQEIGGDSKKQEPRIVLEIPSPRKSTLFELSKDSYKANNMLSRRAVRAHIEAFRKSAEWQDAIKASNPSEAARKVLEDRFHWDWRQDDEHAAGDPDQVFDSLVSYAETRHQSHTAKVHSEWGRGIGLVAARRGLGTWYSPEDSLLKSLVMCVVQDRKEYRRFLADLYEKFRLVIGVTEAEDAFGRLPTDQNAFIRNTERLERRLRTLGLLRRLSDDCAYVENPFRGES